jgi:predicted heme/steroid binding protein
MRMIENPIRFEGFEGKGGKAILTEEGSVIEYSDKDFSDDEAHYDDNEDGDDISSDSEGSTDEYLDPEAWREFNIEKHKFVGDPLSNMVDAAAAKNVQRILLRGAKFNGSEYQYLEDLAAQTGELSGLFQEHRSSYVHMANIIRCNITRALPNMREVIVCPALGKKTAVMTPDLILSPGASYIIRMVKK